MSIFEEHYDAWLAAYYQTKEEIEAGISSLSKSLENPIQTLREEMVDRACKEYLELRLITGAYKKTSGWSAVHFDGKKLIGDELPPDGCCVEWKTADNHEFTAYFESGETDRIDTKIIPYSIEDVVAWQWYYAREKVKED